MAYNGKFTSLQRVVEKVFRDSGIESIDWEAAIEWTAECMAYIGVPYSYEHIVTNNFDGAPEPIEIVDFRAIVPTNLVELVAIRRVILDDNGEVMSYDPMIESNNIFQETPPRQDDLSLTYFDPIIDISEITGTDENGEPTYDDVSYYESGPIKIPTGLPYTYTINDGIIFTNFREGFLELAYRGYPLDAEGYPKIPEDLKFQRALEFYLIFRLDWKRWRANPAQPGLKALLNDSEQKWYAFAGSARTKAHIPNIDKMEGLKNQWLRSIQKVNEHGTSFNTTTAQEVRYNQYSHGRHGGIGRR